jgi:hypothetical protein
VTSASRLVQPNGNAAAVSSLFNAYQAGESTTDFPLCFQVDAPGTGAYRLEWKTSSGEQTTLSFTIP